MNYSGYIMSGSEAVARVQGDNIEPFIREKMPLYLANGGSFSEWLISMAPNFDNNIALISRGYSQSAKKSSNLLIQMFSELLSAKNISYDIPDISKEVVKEIAEYTLVGEEIDRDYVVDFVMDRYERMAKL